MLDHKEMEENASAKNRLAGGFEPLFKDDYTNLFFWVVAMRNAPRIGVFLSHMCHVPSKRWYDDQGDRNHQVLYNVRPLSYVCWFRFAPVTSSL